MSFKAATQSFEKLPSPQDHGFFTRQASPASLNIHSFYVNVYHSESKEALRLSNTMVKSTCSKGSVAFDVILGSFKKGKSG